MEAGPARSDRSSYTALLVVQVLFGLFPVMAKKVLAPGGPLEPFPLLALRVGGAAFCLLALHLVLVKDPIPIRSQFPKVTGLAFLGVILNMGLFMVGLQLTDPTEAVLVITTIPVFTYAIAVLMGREEIGPKRILGIVLAIAGVIVLVGLRADPKHALGDLLVMGNALSYAAFLVLAKPTIQRYDPLSLTTWVFLIGALVFIPLGMVMGLRGQAAQLSTEGVAWVALIIVGPSVLTYVLNAVALRHVAASTVAIFTYVQPIFTAVAAYLLLGQTLNLRVIPAAVLVFAGVWLVARRKPKVLEGQVIGE
ncbi:MAG TPA: DMT family transporter [Candidatus Thermoplasmatota archaeon]|nr:DMT family transporter [Candidatus Thermoplasmatota archaeon]